MLTLTCAGLVGTLPLRGGLTCLDAGCGLAGYWQLSPRPAGGLNGGSRPDAAGDAPAAVVVGLGAAALFPWFFPITK